MDKEAKGSLENFLKNFNQIEYILQKYGQAFQQDFNNKYSKHRRRMSNVRLAEVILQAEKIDPKLFDELRQLITLRNSIVHGASPTVSESMVNKSHEILVSLSDSLNVIVPEKLTNKDITNKDMCREADTYPKCWTSPSHLI
ncbi:HEPN domain-containing protein [Photobacterium leiognathi]|uniref:HEPN domain-containing protein n=1 Tax=Photobacterium leiognathi TaxID=553611 RepID=UPI002739EF78|nr:HEPN domain-containing protein [Photobacterium leiognathi]